jgi:hypothetical protein
MDGSVSCFSDPSIDTDHDGMPDTQEALYEFDPFDPLDAALDADEDGMNNLNEILAGTNPREAADLFKVTSFSVSTGNTMAIEWAAVPGRIYNLWKSTNLVSDDWEWIKGPLMAGDEVLSISVTNTAPALFYKVEVEVP